MGGIFFGSNYDSFTSNSCEVNLISSDDYSLTFTPLQCNILLSFYNVNRLHDNYFKQKYYLTTQ